MMTDRLAFRTLVGLAAVLLLCLASALVVPLQVAWPVLSFGLHCCSRLASQIGMAMPAGISATLLAAVAAGVVLSIMSGNALLAAFRLWWATRRLTRLTRTARLPLSPAVSRLAARLELSDSLVVVAGRVPLSFCYGLWRPRICLSLGLIERLTEAELEAVLHHEAYHMRRREPLRMAIAICLSRLLFFVPLMAELCDRYLAEKELAADTAAVAVTGRAALARAMHKLATMDGQFGLPPLIGVAGLSVTAQRVDRLINPAARLSWTPSLRSILITLAVFVVGCLVVVTSLV